MEHNIKIEVEINCNCELVFELLTNAELISRWSGAEATFDNFTNGEVSLFDGWVNGKILGYELNKAVTFTWVSEDWDEYEDSIVNYTLLSSGEKTHLTIVHNGFPSISERDSHEDGWYDYVLNPIQDYLLEILQYDEM